MVITPGLTPQPRYVGLSVVPTHIDYRSLAAAPVRIGRLVAFAAAVGDAGIPFVKGHREPADREWPRKRHAMLWAFNVDAISFAFRRAHGEAAGRNYHQTDEDHTYVDFVREGAVGKGAARMGNTYWRRLTEERAGSAKSVFHFDVQGSVAKSTHAGIPWLRFIRERLGQRVHFWPFDGWDIPAGRSAIAEVYPALWSRSFAKEGRTGDQHDAFCVAAWLSRADRNGSLAAFLKPDLTPQESEVAQVEGWILGVPGLIRSNLDRKGIDSHTVH